MKRITLFSFCLLMTITTFGQLNSNLDSNELTRKFQLSFVYPIGTSGTNTIQEEYNVSVNIIAGATAGIDGVEVGCLGNYTLGAVKGAQVAGFANLVKDTVQGLQVAGFSNVALKQYEGLQVSGFSNVVIKDFKGAQVSGFANYTGGAFRGTQISGFGNATLDSFTGLQVAGFTNHTAGIKGSQIAGFANSSIGETSGNQIAGFTNVSVGNMEGVQISGFINVAQKIKGAQLGFINYADSLEGIAIGFLSYAKNGYHAFELSSNETFETNLTFKTGSNMFYNAFSLGVHFNKGRAVGGVGYGIGTRKLLGSGFSLSGDLKTYGIIPENMNWNDWESFNKLELSVAKSLGSNLEIFAGGSLNLWLSNEETTTHDYLKWTGHKGHVRDTFWILYPGFQFGIRI